MMRKLHRVIQQHQNGCVPAALATLTGLKYELMMRVIHHSKRPARWDYYGTTRSATLRALNRLGYKAKEIDPIPFNRLSTDALIVVENEAYRALPIGAHVVVWDCDRQRILDPYVGAAIGNLRRHLPMKSYQAATTLIIEVR